jgi:pimeloyl-ACP methyl ester carboxylesterase
LDYRAPDLTKIDLAVIKLPAGDPARRIGTLFVNFGGPGSSGVDRLRVRGRWPWLFSEEIRARFDLMSWDPRGVSHSTAVACFTDTVDRQRFFSTFPEVPDAGKDEANFYQASRELAERCARHSGWLLPHVNSVNTARDLELLRRAVGDAALTYHGISYGTYVGAVYANLFPGRVRALVLDGALDFQGNAAGHGSSALSSPVDTRQGVAEGVVDTFDSFLSQCAEAGPACAFSGGDVHLKWRTLLDRARQHPVTLAGPTGGVSHYTSSAILNLARSLANPRTWADTATTLQRLYEISGDMGSVPGNESANPSTPLDNKVEAYNAIQCADSAVPTSEGLYSRIAASEDNRVPFFGRQTVFNMMSCAYWPRQAVQPYPGPWGRTTAKPVLVINSRVDPATPLRGAVDATNQLAHARLLVVDGAGHTTMYVQSGCAEEAKRDYLIAGLLPREGSVCVVDRPPFGLVPGHAIPWASGHGKIWTGMRPSRNSGTKSSGNVCGRW